MITYRNFELRAVEYVNCPENLRGAWRPWMRELPDGDWREISVLGDNEADAIKIAKECVDYDYRIKVWEFIEGRKYSPTKDGLIEAFD